MARRTRRILAGGLILAALGGGIAAWVVGSSPDWYERLRFPLRYERLVLGNARTFDLDPALIAAVIYAESRFHPDAVSDAGAIGLMQLLPETGEWIAATTGGRRFDPDDLYDPTTNIRFGSYYLNVLLDKYDGNTRIALAAYHAGQTNADRWLKRGGKIGFRDTRAYVASVLDAVPVYRKAYGLTRLAAVGEASAP
ncbi:MAG TPA: lytic transglycosylase domain-containing protein [Planctomycetota bacterium]|nr:lytic transglycosylase domain-containing protein [Planctomycetota bacterium]